MFSERSVIIEAELQALGAAGVEDRGLRARVDDAASLATRRAKDRQFTPAALVGRWETEAAKVGLAVPRAAPGNDRRPAQCSFRRPGRAMAAEPSFTGHPGRLLRNFAATPVGRSGAC